MTRSAALESRWAPIVSVLVMMVVLEGLPNRLQPLPHWVSYAAAASLLVPLLGVQLSRAHAVWKRTESIAVFAFAIYAGFLNIFALVQLLRSMLYHTRELDPIQLLASGVAVWAVNVFTFTFLYWELDDRGPERRLEGARRPDFVFAQSNAPRGVAPDRRPARAKILMMIQSSVSLIAIAIVAARAINILR